MKIVILDGCHVMQESLDFDIIKEFGELVVYYDTKPCEVIERIKDADVVIENRIAIGKAEIDSAKNLKFISTLSTGFNLIDTEYARQKGIVVSNIPAYSSYAVAQSTVGLLLEICSKTSKFNDFVKAEKWDRFDSPEQWAIKQIELCGKTIGIIGMGDIAMKVSNTCIGLGMNVLAYKRNPDPKIENDNLKFDTLDNVLKNSDVISMHCPYTAETDKMINADTISKMKDGVIILNTARGGVINEIDLDSALKSGKVYAFGADVLTQEPPEEDNVLIKNEKAIITPHVAWAPEDTRRRLLSSLYDNLKGFSTNRPVNVVN